LYSLSHPAGTWKFPVVKLSHVNPSIEGLHLKLPSIYSPILSPNESLIVEPPISKLPPGFNVTSQLITLLH